MTLIANHKKPPQQQQQTKCLAATCEFRSDEGDSHRKMCVIM